VAKRPSPVRERPMRYGFFDEMAGMIDEGTDTLVRPGMAKPVF
jgi:hypothetical protein